MLEIMIMKAAIQILALQDYINLRSMNFRHCNNKIERLMLSKHDILEHTCADMAVSKSLWPTPDMVTQISK